RALVGRANVFEEEATFAPLADLIRRELGVDRDEEPTLVRKRLDELVSGCCDASDMEQTAGRLGLALGMGGPAGRGEGRSYRAAEIRAGLLSLLQGMARQGPVVMVLEDLQLARPGLLDLVEQIVDSARRIPVLVPFVARDRLLVVRPSGVAS